MFFVSGEVHRFLQACMLNENYYLKSCMQTCNFFYFLCYEQRAIRAGFGTREDPGTDCGGEKASTGHNGNAADLGRESRGQDALWHLDNRIAAFAGKYLGLAGLRFYVNRKMRRLFPTDAAFLYHIQGIVIMLISAPATASMQGSAGQMRQAVPRQCHRSVLPP